MRAMYCAASLLLTFACANAEESHNHKSLTILFHFEQPYAQSALKQTEREVKALLEAADAIKLEWHDRADFEGKPTYSTVVILNFLGNCDPSTDSSHSPTIDGWLARMHVFDGVVLPFGDVNCDLVRALMSKSSPSTRVSDEEFGRALARVLAHELYHFVTQSTAHADQGLEKRSFSRADLSAGGLRLERAERDRLSKSMLLK